MIKFELFEEILNHTQDAVLVFNKYQKIIYFNSKFLSITKYKKEDIENKAIQVFYPKLKFSGVMKIFGCAINNESDQCGIINIENRTYRLTTKGISDLILCMFQDITELNDLKKELSQKSAKLKTMEMYNRNLLDSSMDMIIAVDHDRKITTFNKAAQEKFGYTLDEILGKHVNILYDSHQEGLETHKAVLTHGKTIREVRNVKKNGETFTCRLVTSEVLDDQGHRIGVMGISHDISELKKQKEKFNKLKNRFEFSQSRLENLGNSNAIKKVLKQVDLVAETNMTVIMQGASGTGKELFSRLLHEKSGRNEKPYIAVDCGAIPESLIESELFGHEKGAFTGADSREAGVFERANGGTLLLDEITNLNSSAQAKLLRVLQERCFTRVGGSELIKFDVRIIAASNIEINEAVKKGNFRLDLYHRLNEFSIYLPLLKERIEDIPILAEKFLKEVSIELDKKFIGISANGLSKLTNYSWPGNVREMRNVIRKAALVCDKPIIDEEHIILEDFQPNSSSAVIQQLKKGNSLKEITDNKQKELEIQLIEYAMDEAHGNKSKAAELLGMKRATLYAKLRQYELI